MELKNTKDMSLFNFKTIPRTLQLLAHYHRSHTDDVEEGLSHSQSSPQTPPPEPSVLFLLAQDLCRRRRFESDEIEELYERYVMEANVTHLTHLLGLLTASCSVLQPCLVLINFFDKGPPSKEEDSLTTPILFVILFSVFVYIGSMCLVSRNEITEIKMAYISYGVIFTFILHELVLTHIAATHIWATLCYVYIVYALLPIRLPDAIFFGFIISIVHILVLHIREGRTLSYYRTHYREVLGNLLFIMCVIIMGVFIHFPDDMAKRKAFNETRQYIKARIAIQKETKRQKKLLLSVLPEHLAQEMTANIAEETCPLDKMQCRIYLKTYDPVSILFADICGFTKMADQSPAQYVVLLLNDLYCRFDRLATNNRCLRIKLLGDCYFCVSGLPQRTPFHADCCVNMGLEIVNAMQIVRDKFDVDVQIRVGIHSGRVYCGVLGLKKWQFDVWSKDVTLANYLESGGLPGHVHISEVTKNFLTEFSAFTCEPAFGDEREPALKEINTFFVTSTVPIQAEPENKVIVKLPTRETPEQNLQHSTDHVMFSPLTVKEVTLEKEVIKNMYISINSRSLRRLKKANCKPVVLSFRSTQLEKDYNKEPDKMLQTYFITSCLAYLIISAIQFTILQNDFIFLVSFAIGLTWMTLAVTLIMAGSFKRLHCPITTLSMKISQDRSLAQILSIITIIITWIVIIVPTVVSNLWWKCENDKSLVDTQDLHCPAKHLPYAEFALHFTILIMIMASSFQIIEFKWKVLLLLFTCGIYGSLFVIAPRFMRFMVTSGSFQHKYLLMMVTMVSVFILILVHSQQSEIIHRLDFIWKIQASDEKEEKQKMQELNQKLIENILPAHVAKIYLEGDRQHDDLYHETCGNACILFACITNFSFTRDASLNISILNKIISDFDDILNDPHFRCIEKIKSTGAVYMAVAGLSTSCSLSEMNHVTIMGDYAIRLKQHVLEVINRQLKTDFTIQIGIHVGPVVAGVIGANMPQYDIWGNTVNVASRMYSTGLPNMIQVTPDVAEILKAHGFQVKQRGKVNVKGKGDMVTFVLSESREVNSSGLRTSTGSTDSK